MKNADAIEEELQKTLKTLTLGEVMERLTAFEGAATPINNVEMVVENEQVVSRAGTSPRSRIRNWAARCGCRRPSASYRAHLEKCATRASHWGTATARCWWSTWATRKKNSGTKELT